LFHRTTTDTHEVLGPVKAVMEEGGELPVIYFSEGYLQQAGRWLAAIWREGLQ
jgi:hypothetical protein